MMDQILWGSIGCGDVMEVKSGPALQNTPHSTLHAVMRRDADLAKDFAQRHGVPHWYDEAAALIHHPEVNAVYIATPPDTHLHYTRMIAQAGKPIYVEKPMANSYAQCLEMIDIAKTYQVPLFVAYYRRALPRFLKVKQIIDSGQLGDLREVRINLLQQAKDTDKSGVPNWRVIPEVAGCGYFCDLASHIFDYLQYVLGDIQSATGRSENRGGYYKAEDRVQADFEFNSGLKGVGLWDFNATEDIDLTEIIGSKGKLAFTFFGEAYVTVSTDHGNTQHDIANPLHIQQPLIQLIVNELRGVGSCPSNGISAAKTNRVLDQILGRI